jgi:hypothetical protein
MTANKKASLSDPPGHMENEASQSQGKYNYFLRKIQSLTCRPDYPIICGVAIFMAAAILAEVLA